MEKSKLSTKKYYDNNAVWWATERSNVEYNREIFGKFQKILPTGKIIELGCGQGRDAGLFIPAGYNYVGIDISDGMIAQSKLKFPNAKFITMDLCDLKFSDNSFDGFWSSAAYLHIKKSEIYSAIKEINRVVRINGIGYISIKKGSGEKYNNKGDDQRYWSFYGKNQFSIILKECGFDILDFWEDKRKYNPPKDVTIFLNYFIKKVR